MPGVGVTHAARGGRRCLRADGLHFTRNTDIDSWSRDVTGCAIITLLAITDCEPTIRQFTRPLWYFEQDTHCQLKCKSNSVNIPQAYDDTRTMTVINVPSASVGVTASSATTGRCRCSYCLLSLSPEEVEGLCTSYYSTCSKLRILWNYFTD